MNQPDSHSIKWRVVHRSNSMVIRDLKAKEQAYTGRKRREKIAEEIRLDDMERNIKQLLTFQQKLKKQIGGIHRRINNEIFTHRLSMRHKHSQISRIFKRLVALELKDKMFESVSNNLLTWEESGPDDFPMKVRHSDHFKPGGDLHDWYVEKY